MWVCTNDRLPMRLCTIQKNFSVPVILFLWRKTKTARTHLLLLGPSDSGKTYLFSQLLFSEDKETFTSIAANTGIFNGERVSQNSFILRNGRPNVEIFLLILNWQSIKPIGLFFVHFRVRPPSLTYRATNGYAENFWININTWLKVNSFLLFVCYFAGVDNQDKQFIQVSYS